MFFLFAAAIAIGLGWLFVSDVMRSSPPDPPEPAEPEEEPSDRQRLLFGAAFGGGHFVLYLAIFSLTFMRSNVDSFESVLQFLLGLPLMPLAFVFPLPMLLMLLNSALWGLAAFKWGPELWRRIRGRRPAS